MSKNIKRQGFTLIELIIVVAIIGILAAIAVPKFGDIQKTSKIKADIATAKIIYDAALRQYTMNNAQNVGEVTASLFDLQVDPEVTLTTTEDFYVIWNGNEPIVYVGTEEETTVAEAQKLEVYPKDTNPKY